MEYVNVSWEEIEDLVDKIAEDVKASPVEPKYLYAVDQQSLVVALMLSRKLGNIPISNNGRKNYMLFVSNFINTGSSLSRVTEKSNCFVTACLFLNKDSKFSPDFIGDIKEKGIWYVFPWDKKEKKAKRTEHKSFENIIQKIKGDKNED